jgi:lysophospholipase L1-like esterase
MTRRELGSRALLALLAPLVFVGLLEGAAVLAGVTPLSEQERASAFRSHRYCQFSPVHAGRRCSPERLRAEGRRKLAVIGGSSVQGYPPGESEPFPEQLGALLEASQPGEWAVFNLGMMCKDSIYVRRCAENALAAGLAYLVIYSGHNDFANWGYGSPDTMIWLEEHAWIYEIESWLSGSRAYSALAEVLQGEAPSRPGEADVPEPRREGATASILAKFDSNLTSVLARAAAVGTKVILVTVGSNLHDFPVPRKAWPELLTPEPSPYPAPWREAFVAGIESFQAKEYDAALSHFEEARDRYGAGRAPGALNARLRLIAARHPEAHLVDFETELRSRAGEGIGCNYFGSDHYCDQFHPNSRASRLIAESILGKLSELEAVR